MSLKSCAGLRKTRKKDKAETTNGLLSFITKAKK